ncbi:YgfZ/GcvT domain-containing protein [Hydromonas duriensis]|uniref:Uncharacterized protein n=1 Tax=Hydromonas duriensis TaxID=1527608 RepID=A0A4R6Y8Y6_9BURK|nr:folate-binding protein YgfZ [Hydromonas duriensis]TDR31883.1 hypothetical protein DFR44_107100 [Hydromonas duriensis]
MHNSMQFTLNQLKQGVSSDLSLQLGLIRVSGEDARSFLHAQLTQNVSNLTEDITKLAGYCSAKGRLYAIFQMYCEGDDVFLITQRELIVQVVKRLRMFVLRAKVNLDDVSEQYHMYGFAGDGCLAAGVAERDNNTTRLGILPAMVEGSELSRELMIVPADKGAIDVASLSRQEFITISEMAWRWLAVMAGEPSIQVSTVEAFVPQMVNLDRIGGVNFKKGCYPGQEVVARSHYLGKLKRRMIAVRWGFERDALAQAALERFNVNADVYSRLDETQPAGVVVSAAQNVLQTNVIDALLEVSLAMLDGDACLSVQGMDVDGKRFDLPYALVD